MAQFRFYVSKGDRWNIIKDLLKLGRYAAMPNLNYDSSSPSFYVNATPALGEALEINPCVYLKRVSGATFSFTHLDKGKYAGTFVVDQRNTGGVLLLSLPTERRDQGIEQFPPGLLSCHERVWNATHTSVVAPSIALKEDFAAIKGVLIKALHRIKVPKSIWIGNEAKHMFDEGNATLLVDGHWIKK